MSGDHYWHSIFVFIYISLYFSPIDSTGTTKETIDLSKWEDNCGDKVNYLEHVEVSVNLNYTLRGELLIKLRSPQGTVSNLTHYRKADAAFGAKDLNWVLMTLHHWGENATGPWTLTMENSHPDHANTGRWRERKRGIITENCSLRIC